MIETIVIEKATPAFVESFCKTVGMVAKERKFLGNTVGFPLESTKQYIQKIVSHNYAQYYAIEEDEIIGWCDIIPKSNEGMKHVGILGLGILNEYRGNGIGTELLKITLEHARKINKLEKVELETFESNKYAIELYKRMGFNIEGRKPKARKLDDEYDNIILMGKFLYILANSNITYTKTIKHIFATVDRN